MRRFERQKNCKSRSHLPADFLLQWLNKFRITSDLFSRMLCTSASSSGRWSHSVLNKSFNNNPKYRDSDLYEQYCPNYFHVADLRLRIQRPRKSRNSMPFMAPLITLSGTKKAAVCPWSQLHKSSLHSHPASAHEYINSDTCHIP
jgi:hypothetical protein